MYGLIAAIERGRLGRRNECRGDARGGVPRRLAALEKALQAQQVLIELRLRIGTEEARHPVPERTGGRVVMQLDLEASAAIVRLEPDVAGVPNGGAGYGAPCEQAVGLEPCCHGIPLHQDSRGPGDDPV